MIPWFSSPQVAFTLTLKLPILLFPHIVFKMYCSTTVCPMLNHVRQRKQKIPRLRKSVDCSTRGVSVSCNKSSKKKCQCLYFLRVAFSQVALMFSFPGLWKGILQLNKHSAVGAGRHSLWMLSSLLSLWVSKVQRRRTEGMEDITLFFSVVT